MQVATGRTFIQIDFSSEIKTVFNMATCTTSKVTEPCRGCQWCKEEILVLQLAGRARRRFNGFKKGLTSILGTAVRPLLCGCVPERLHRKINPLPGNYLVFYFYMSFIALTIDSTSACT